MREILFVAGETSGDLHGAGVARALARLGAEHPLAGIGGDEMRRAGVELLEHCDRMQALGLSEVVRHLPGHLRLLRALKRRLSSGRVGLLVLIDYPGFNMKLAAAAANAGVPVLYYITPQVWAWGAGRLARLASTVTKAAVILPFEEPLLRSHGVDATFVGHPLMDHAPALPDRAAARAALQLPQDAPVLALFPGSRDQEIARHLETFVAAAQQLRRRTPNLEVIVSGAPGMELDQGRCPFRVVRAASFDLYRAADAALCKSGTTTLEAAVAGCPFVIAYRTSWLTFSVARHVVKIPHIGLVNVVAERQVVPEFVQGRLEAGAVAAALAPLLEHGSDERNEMLRGLASVRSALGAPGAADRVAQIAIVLADGGARRPERETVG